MKTGTVYLVGAGPGDPSLLTLRGKELLSRADVVVYDYLASPRLLEHAPAGAKHIYVGKQAAQHAMDQADINRLLVRLAKEGKTVVRLKGGDPYVFGRGGEEALELVEADVPFEVVPGITSGIAATAYSGIPVTHRGLAACVALITGHETPDKDESDLDWTSLAAWKGTLAFYMGVSNVAHICRQLIDHGLSADTPAAIIRWGATPRQQVVAGTVATLPGRVAAAKLKPPAMIVVGAVVALRDKLNWFERRPLFGRRIVVTRARAQASQFAAALEELGAEVIETPAITIAPAEDPQPLRDAAGRLDRFNWIVFTSVNGVDAFFAALAAVGKDARALAPCRVTAIGPATTERLASFGIRPDAQPAQFIGAAVVETLAAIEDLRGKSILCPRADIAPKELIDALAARGANVTEIAAYRTVPDAANAAEIADLLKQKEIHWITFTSSSTAEYFLRAVPVDVVRAGGARVASIGPSTTATLKRLGLPPSIEAKAYTIPGLIDAILEQESNGSGR